MFLLIFFVLGAGAALIIAYLLALVFMVIYTLVSYLFESMFLSRVYHRKKDKHAWISYIPFVNKYFYGNLVECRIQGIIIAILDFVTCIYIFLSCRYSNELFLCVYCRCILVFYFKYLYFS